ncbi:hypothetical protein UFO1_0687 [Pelosinus sp. UFO1]|nr:hypothetical protein UFO1_0687 [Pelosinus sp. UFO1]
MYRGFKINRGERIIDNGAKCPQSLCMQGLRTFLILLFANKDVFIRLSIVLFYILQL